MASPDAKYFEDIASSIASLDRNEVVRRIRNFKGRFKLDFTHQYLSELTVDRLRHILFAAIIANSKKRN